MKIYTKKIATLQVIRKAEDKAKAATVEADQVKEKSLAVAGGRCWKRVWLRALKRTGELNIYFSRKF